MKLFDAIPPVADKFIQGSSGGTSGDDGAVVKGQSVEGLLTERANDSGWDFDLDKCIVLAVHLSSKAASPQFEIFSTDSPFGSNGTSLDAGDLWGVILYRQPPG